LSRKTLSNSATNGKAGIRIWPRVPFNRAAKALAGDDNLPGLKLLACELVAPGAPRGGSLEEFLQVCNLAACEAAEAWYEHGGNCYEKVRKAIRSAARDYRGTGNGRSDVTWRGGYSTDARKFGSQLHSHAAAVELLDVMDGNSETAADGPDEVSTAGSNQFDAKCEKDQGSENARREHIAERHERTTGIAETATGVAGNAAERTSHDGGHGDGERLNPRDDGETAYGVDGATRGLHTGRLLLKARTIAKLTALDELSEDDRKFLLAIDKAGGRDNYVNANRKHRREEIERRERELNARLRQREREILAVGEEELVAAVGVQHTDVPRVPYDSPAGVEPVRGVLSWPEAPSRVRGNYSTPFFVPFRSGSPFGFRFCGSTWADHKRLLRGRYRERSLLDRKQDLTDFDKEWDRRMARLRVAGWDRPLIVQCLVSLLDTV